MSVEELRWVARGCVSSSVFVFFSYAFIAATKMMRKLDVDAPAGVVCHIVAHNKS